SAFVYPAPGGAEAESRTVEDQPQSLDEIDYAPAYSTRQAEIPVEPSGGGQSAAPDLISSQAPDGVMGEAVIESHVHTAAVDFASSNAIEEAGIEVQTENAGVYIASSEAPDEVMAGGRMGMAGPGLASPNMLGAIEAESRTETTTTDFTPSEGGDEGLDK